MKLFSKYPWIISIAIGAITALAYFYFKSERALLSGLFLLFILREGKQDERAKYLTFSSAYYALLIGYLFKLITEARSITGISFIQINSIDRFLILVFAIANVLRYTQQYFSWNQTSIDRNDDPGKDS